MGMEAKEYIIRELKATKRRGMKNLITYMEEAGFFEAPCSSKFHLHCPGGLAQHTMNVMQHADKLAKLLLTTEDYKEMRNSIRIAAGLHDLGKAGQFGKPYYVEKVLKSGKQSEAEPYQCNKDRIFLEHCFVSVAEASKCIELTEEEQWAIFCHDGLYGPMKYEYKGKETKLSMIVHAADLWCSSFVEGGVL